MQVVYSAVHYAHDCFYCNYTGESFFYSYEIIYKLVARVYSVLLFPDKPVNGGDILDF